MYNIFKNMIEEDNIEIEIEIDERIAEQEIFKNILIFCIISFICSYLCMFICVGIVYLLKEPIDKIVIFISGYNWIEFASIGIMLVVFVAMMAVVNDCSIKLDTKLTRLKDQCKEKDARILELETMIECNK